MLRPAPPMVRGAFLCAGQRRLFKKMYLQSCQTFYIRTADFWFAKCHCMGYNIFICESAAILRERRARMEQNEQQLMKLEGTVEHVIYENADTGYAVFEVDANGTDVVVAGNVGGVDNGMSVTVYGHMVNHPSYGEQFRAETIEARLPEDTSAILSYLSSGVLPYIGPSTAKKIVSRFGEDTLTVIAETPQRLCELKGITEQKAAVISNEFRRMYGVREVVAWFARYGLTAQQAVTAYRAFGPHTVEALTQNPYLLCGEPLQLKFGQVDGIAAALQFETGCRLRVTAGLLYALRHNAGNGHTCLPRGKLLETTSKFLRVAPPEIEAGLEELLSTEELRTRTFDGTEYIYLPDLYAAEEDIAARLGQLSTFPTEAPKTLDTDIRALEIAQGFAYAPLQQQAIRLALSSRVMVLTGGPGTGKTTTVNAILALYEAMYDRVALCAPTGRAAKRLSELTHHAASTIHRLLEVDYSTGNVRFIHNEKNLLKYDVIILDEMSMVDVKLFQALLAAARYHCRIIMVGDADQLPSVGPGNILGEILRADVVPTVRLTDIFRQAQKSLIVQNAHRIVEGQMPQKGGAQDDFFMIEANGLACQKLVCDLVSTRLPKAYGFDPVRDIQVLCPTKVGPTGSVELNRRLQEILNPPAKGKAQLGTAESAKILRLGDKVMQIKNDYDITFERQGAEAGVGAYNGDMGVITGVDVDARSVTVQMDDRKYTYTADQLNELEPAYAVTVHKSQGSEFPAVVLPAADVPARLCYRNLLYTGVTRARRLCVLTGTARTEQAMVQNVRQNMRFSGLRYLLKEAAAPADNGNTNLAMENDP
jgi:exodeoxyribonuclease V alpha subunit